MYVVTCEFFSHVLLRTGEYLQRNYSQRVKASCDAPTQRRTRGNPDASHATEVSKNTAQTVLGLAG